MVQVLFDWIAVEHAYEGGGGSGGGIEHDSGRRLGRKRQRLSLYRAIFATRANSTAMRKEEGRTDP